MRLVAVLCSYPPISYKRTCPVATSQCVHGAIVIRRNPDREIGYHEASYSNGNQVLEYTLLTASVQLPFALVLALVLSPGF